MCKMKGKSSEQCQNFVRVLKMQDPETLLVCGTNAYKPRCRTYLVTVSIVATGPEGIREGRDKDLARIQFNYCPTSARRQHHLSQISAGTTHLPADGSAGALWVALGTVGKLFRRSTWRAAIQTQTQIHIQLGLGLGRNDSPHARPPAPKTTCCSLST